MAKQDFEMEARRKELAGGYAQKIEDRKNGLMSHLSNAEWDFIDWRSYVRRYHPEVKYALDEALAAGAVPSVYIKEHMPWFLAHVLPASLHEVFLGYVDGLRDYPYSVSYSRRSYRSSSYALYADQIEDIMRDCARAYCYNITPAAALTRTLSEDAQAYLDERTWDSCGYFSWQVTCLLDAHDPATEEAVRSVLTCETGGAVTHALVRGILRAHRPEFHELVGKLLLAARLQEGVRQVICESGDCGTREAFLCLLRVIEENDLIRFSSVKRAVGTWLGLLSEEVRDLDRISDKSVRLIIDYLEDPDTRDAAMASEDAMEIYIALWAHAFDSLETATVQVERLINEGTHHQILVAGYFAALLDDRKAAHRMALRAVLAHPEENDILAVFLPCVLRYRSILLRKTADCREPATLTDYFADPDEAYALATLMERKLTEFKGKAQTVSPCVFPWFEAKITKNDLTEVYCTTAALAGTPDLIDKACPMLPDCPPNGRYGFIPALLSPPQSAVQRRALLEALADKEGYTRKEALKLVKGIHLTAEEYFVLESFLRFKSEEVRSAVLELLLKQNDTALTASIGRLLDSPKEEMRLGGLDLLTQLKSDKVRSALVSEFLPRLSARLREDNVPSKEKILLETFVPAAAEEKAAPPDALFEFGDTYLPDVTDDELMPDEFAPMAKEAVALFAHYFPDGEIESLVYGKKKSFFGVIKDAFGGKGDKPCRTAEEAREDLLSLSEYVTAHLHDVVMPMRSPDDAVKPMMLGEITYGFYYDSVGECDMRITAAELWDAWATERGMTPERILRAEVRLQAHTRKSSFEIDANPLLRALFGEGFEEPVALPQEGKVTCILRYLHDRFAIDGERLGAALGLWFMRCVPDSLVMAGEGKKKEHLLTHEQLYQVFSLLKCRSKETMPLAFPVAVAVAERCIAAGIATPEEESPYVIRYNSASCMRMLRSDYRGRITGLSHSLVGVNEYIRAVHYGVIREAEFFEFALRPSVLHEALRILTSLSASFRDGERAVTTRGVGNPYWLSHIRARRTLGCLVENPDHLDEEGLALLATAERLMNRLLPVVLDAEYKRGDSPALYSDAISGIQRVSGVGHLVRILEALGNDTLNRTGYGSNGRNYTLTHLLGVCIPAPEDTADTLRAALNGRRITEKRLVEAALYAPEWIPLIGEYLGTPSFESVCYYFIAHMNERFDDKRRAVIARYTPLGEEELNQGAFDRAWFESAYAAVGEKRFDLIYGAAKYISDGAKHARARKYADACLGRYTVEDMEKTISDKRNKDLLMAYALIPSAGEDDICRRYLYIGNFRKESKKFGSQRAVSEAKAADMALTNLAQTAGYRDTMRLTLRMETKLMDDLRTLLCPHTIDGVTIEPVIGEDGKTELTVTKDGKTLKSIPAKLKKHETVLALTELKKTLTEQYRRTRLMFEEAMECESVFTMEEISALFAHPVVAPMLARLVFVSGDTCGLPTECGLRSADGTEHILSPDAPLTVAHPYTLYSLGVWRDWQAYLYEHTVTQPFRQVFRELYTKTADECGTDHSLRYAGHQIQPAKTVSVLKSRRWVADVEDGLQKVYYRENIVARIYAMADWFTPADIEAPTLEYVEFVDRHTGKSLPINDIPDILFSEVMRDVDLAVSVAHVGGVDPEASHSTVEMREAILSFVLPLFRLTNVKVENSRALIDGKLANYTVHLGSGVVHQIGGAMIPVLPVHSQHRGRVFLPFVDDDPKTAEIISKVILFAEDDKIRDPMILSAIRR